MLHILLGTARGGCEWDALCLVQQSPALMHQVLVLGGPGEMSEEFRAAGAAIYHANVLRESACRVIQCVREAVARWQPDGVMIWHGMVRLPEMLHALRDFPGRVLVHAGNPAHTLPRWVDWRYWLREKWLGRRCAATYVCCSQYVADSFQHSLYLRRFPRVVVFNGVKPLTVPPHEPRAIAPGAPFTIGMTARLDHIKDHATLLRAFALVVKEWPAARLELAGDGDQRPGLEQLARELGVAEQVRFLGSVPDVYAVMQHWDVFAYATTAHEGLGNALTEAMMLGLPCVVTDVGPMREVGAQTVRYVGAANSRGLADQILAVIRDEPLRQDLHHLANNRAALEFSPAVFADRHVRLILPPSREREGLLHILTGTARGGCEGNALCLIQQAPSLNHHLLVLGGPGEMSEELSAAGAAVHHANVLRAPACQVVQCVREAAERWQPEGVIIWHGMVRLPEMLHALRDFPGRVLVHAGNPAHTLPRWVDWRYWLREKWLGRRCAATYVCCSQYVADSFQHSRYLRRFPRVVVFNGVKPLMVPPHEPRAIASGAPFTIGMTARLDHIKDHATLLRAFALVVKEWPAARLELAGDGDQRSGLEQLARELGVAEQVCFLGSVSDVYAVMQHWDVFAYATTEREGLGNALAEAMMLGLPCVVTDAGPVREVLGKGNYTACVPAGDATAIAGMILRFAPSFSERVASGENGRTRARAAFTPEAFTAGYISALGMDQALTTSDE